MELKTLRYFLAVCQEGNMSRAAARLHVTQPTLSRQISELERELGTSLFIRRSRSVEPTEAGLFLRRRAADIVSLVDQTVIDFKGSFGMANGEISIVASDPQGIQSIAHLIRKFRQEHPGVRFHLHNSDNEHALVRLGRGLDDFAVLIGYPHSEGYDSAQIGPTERWGVFMQASNPLARKKRITRADLIDKPLIVPDRTFSYDFETFRDWFGGAPEDFNIHDTYMHGRSGTVLINDEIGYMIGGDSMAPSGKETGLEFRLLDPPVSLQVEFVWKRGRMFSSAAQLFLDYVIEGESKVMMPQ